MFWNGVKINTTLVMNLYQPIVSIVVVVGAATTRICVLCIGVAISLAIATILSAFVFVGIFSLLSFFYVCRVSSKMKNLGYLDSTSKG